MAESPSINLLHKAFDVIELLADRGCEMGVSEISRRLHMVKSGTFRILNTLKERDLVYQNPETKNYGLGLKFYFIGSSAQARLPLCVISRKYLDELSFKYHECFSLSIPYSQGSGATPSYLTVYSSGGSTALGHSGALRPLHATAAGKCLLAFSSDSEVQSYAGYELEACTAKTVTSWDDLREQLALIRERGYALSSGEFEDQVSGLAVPVYDSMHSLLGAIGISLSSKRLQRLSEHELVTALKGAGRAIGRSF